MQCPLLQLWPLGAVIAAEAPAGQPPVHRIDCAGPTRAGHQVLHVPSMQVCPVAHLCVQVPQLFGSLVVSAHPLGQRIFPRGVAAGQARGRPW